MKDYIIGGNITTQYEIMIETMNALGLLDKTDDDPFKKTKEAMKKIIAAEYAQNGRSKDYEHMIYAYSRISDSFEKRFPYGNNKPIRKIQTSLERKIAAYQG